MEITKALLTINPYSRPGYSLAKVTHIVIHWVANPGTAAINNRNYFESLKTKKVYASSHYIIGLQGEIILCVPESEIAYHASKANSYSIGIENCHPDSAGKFNSATYSSLIELCTDICNRYHLDPQTALIRHYDVTGKICPRYYVKNEQAWKQLKSDVAASLAKLQSITDLMTAVKGLIAIGIKIDINVWGNTNTMNMKYAELLITKIGMHFGQADYKSTVDFLVSKGCINTRSVWDAKNFKAEWCKGLLINIYNKLVK